MTEPHDHDHLTSDVEALVRAAGGYVRPSDDLRPRVLENARTERFERRVQRRVWQLAAALLLLGALTPSLRSSSEGSATDSQQLSVDSGAAGDQAADGRGHELGWDIVESFRELRRRQAELLRLAM